MPSSAKVVRQLIPRGTRDDVALGRRGFWYLVNDDPAWRYAVLVCPGCGEPSTIQHLTRVSRGRVPLILSDGSVSLVVACKSCVFRAFLKLAAWNARG